MKFQICLLLLYITNCAFSLLLTRPSDHDVFSGRHFNELVAKDGKVIQSCVLAMYKPSCDSKLQEYKLFENLPQDCYLTFLKYDYQSTPKYSWYHFDKDDDLYERYQPKACLELLYFPFGTSLDSPQRYHAHTGKKVSDAVWGLVKVKFSIRNLYGSNIAVTLEVKKKIVSSIVLAPTHEEEATAYVTHNLFVKDSRTGKLIYATVIDLSLDGTEIAIDKYIAMDVKESEWRRDLKQKTDEENDKVTSRIHNMAQRYLLDMKQPAVVPTFTETGYDIQVIPPFLLKELNKFYSREGTDAADMKKLKEKINHIDMPIELAQKVDLILRFSIEEWADTSLQFSRTFGIHEHLNQSYVYGHLGNVASHVFGLVLVLKKDLGEAEDWPFEIIGHDGQRHNLTLKEGEFIMYESATCLLGNPYPFKGNLYVTAPFFFRPDEGWKWKISGDGKNLVNGNEIKESINIYATTNMLERSKQKTGREEL